MVQKDLDSWEACEAEIENLKKYRDELCKESSHVSQFLYRGQPNTEGLKTTLERFYEKRKNQISFKDYYRKIFVVKPIIESYTQHIFRIPSLAKYDELLNVDDGIFIVKGNIYKAYDYRRSYATMVSLRPCWIGHAHRM